MLTDFMSLMVNSSYISSSKFSDSIGDEMDAASDSRVPRVIHPLFVLRMIAVWLAMILTLGRVGAKLVPTASNGPLRAVMVCNFVAIVAFFCCILDWIFVFIGAAIIKFMLTPANWIPGLGAFTKELVRSFMNAPIAEKFCAASTTILVGAGCTTYASAYIWISARIQLVVWQYLLLPLLEGANKLMHAVLEILPHYKLRSLLDVKSYYGLTSHPVAMGTLYLCLERHVLNLFCSFFIHLNLHFQGNLAMEVLMSVILATIGTLIGAVYVSTMLIANEAFVPVLHAIVAKMELHPRSAFRVLSALYRPLQSVKIAVL